MADYSLKMAPVFGTNRHSRYLEAGAFFQD